jgi:carboxyl-terminal processing protease
MAPRTRRVLFSVSIFLATCGIFGSIVGQRVAAQSASDESTLRDSLKTFTSVYAIVEQNYAEKMNTDRADKAIYDGAIPGMLHTLDPHSNFYDPKAFAQMREDQHGHYYGVRARLRSRQVSSPATRLFQSMASRPTASIQRLWPPC